MSEILVVLALVVIIVTLGFFNFVHFQRQTLLNSEVAHLAAMLFLARSKSMAQERDLAYKVVIFSSGFSLVSQDGRVVETRQIEPGLVLTSSHPQILFAKRSGLAPQCLPECTVTVTVTTLVLAKIVSVSSQGVINVP